MNTTRYRFRFGSNVSASEMEDTLMLALMAVDGLYGRTRRKLDGCYRIDKEKRLCEIGATTKLGFDLGAIFAHYAVQEFGVHGVVIERHPLLPGSTSGNTDAPYPRSTAS